MVAGSIEAADRPGSPAAPKLVSSHYRGHSAGYWHFRTRSAESKLLATRAALKRTLGPYKTRPPHYYEWMCIHRGEGSWVANTGNGYFGGLQMDLSFQRTYGWDLYATKGTADNWTPLEQMWVAEKAWASGRGFYPWPTTARNCGLI